MPAAWTYGFSAYANLPPEAFRRRCLGLLAGGFGALEVFAVGDIIDATTFDLYTEAIGAVVAESGASLSVHLPTTDVNPLARNRRVAQASLESQKAAIAWAGQIGATLAVLHLGSAPGVLGSPQGRGDERFGRFWKLSQTTLADLAACARSHRVHLTIENLIGPREVAASPDLLTELLETPGCEDVGLTVDLSHALLGGYDVAAFVRQVAPRLWHVHANDTDRQGDRHWPLGQGQLPLAQAVDALRAVGFAGTFLLEIDGPAELLQRSRQTVEALL